MLLSRTRANLAFKARLLVWDRLGIQRALDEAEKRELEDHMGFRGQWYEHRRFQVETIRSLGLRPEHRLLEFGCGPLTLGIPIICYLDPGHYTGVDIRAEVLNLGVRQIGRHGLAARNPRVVCSSSFGREELGDERFDFAWSFSVLYHLSDDLLAQLLQQVARRLASGGQYIANINSEHEESRWLQFPFLRRALSFYEAEAARAGLRVEDLGSLESLGFRLDSAEKSNHLLRFTPA